MEFSWVYGEHSAVGVVKSKAVGVIMYTYLFSVTYIHACMRACMHTHIHVRWKSFSVWWTLHGLQTGLATGAASGLHLFQALRAKVLGKIAAQTASM